MGGIENKLASLKDGEWDDLDRKALGIIWLCLVESIDFNILKEKTAKDLMKALAKLYENPHPPIRYFL